MDNISHNNKQILFLIVDHFKTVNVFLKICEN